MMNVNIPPGMSRAWQYQHILVPVKCIRRHITFIEFGWAKPFAILQHLVVRIEYLASIRIELKPALLICNTTRHIESKLIGH